MPRSPGYLQHVEYTGSELTFSGVKLVEIARHTGTPVYIYSGDALLNSLREFQDALAAVDHLICFAVKSNSNIAILKLLGKAGAGLDLVSGGELYRARQAGVAGPAIVFSGVGKTKDEIAQALTYADSGIFSFNVESAAELETINSVARELGRKAAIALRFNPDVDAKTHPYVSTGLKKNKFGVHRSEILEIARRLNEFDRIALKGISIHIGSQLVSLGPLGDAFGRVTNLCEEVNQILGNPLSFIDLGGGLGIQYGNKKAPSIRSYCSLVLKHFGPGTAFSRRNSPFRILIEPGRVLAGNSGVLVTELLYRKRRAKKEFLIVDSGMNDLIRPALYGSHHELLPLKKGSGPRTKYDIVGPVCETSDCFAQARSLPTRIQPGDLIAILSAGAYGFSMASNYNSRPRPPEVLIENGRFRVIRDREKYEDLLRGERV